MCGLSAETLEHMSSLICYVSFVREENRDLVWGSTMRFAPRITAADNLHGNSLHLFCSTVNAT